MRSSPTRLEGPILIDPVAHGDERGFFVETYRREWHASAGIPEAEQFVQDNQSRSRRGVVRGMHFQIGAGVAKLVRCARGSVLDVVVDLRRASSTYAHWEAVELSDCNHRQMYVPVGFAHGFCVLSDEADMVYKQTAYYDAQLERGIAYDDPDVAIKWPLPADVLSASARDSAAPRLSQIADKLPF